MLLVLANLNSSSNLNLAYLVRLHNQLQDSEFSVNNPSSSKTHYSDRISKLNHNNKIFLAVPLVASNRSSNNRQEAAHCLAKISQQEVVFSEVVVLVNHHSVSSNLRPQASNNSNLQAALQVVYLVSLRRPNLLSVSNLPHNKLSG